MASSNFRIAATGIGVLAADQATKSLVVEAIPHQGRIEVLDGFFHLVHWGNTGAAWSLFEGNNHWLAWASLAALFLLIATRRHFDAHLPMGQAALGLLLGGIAGNLIDRVTHQHVIDFLYFHVFRRDGTEAGFPAFNLADSAICIGVGLLFILSWRTPDTEPPAPENAESTAS